MSGTVEKTGTGYSVSCTGNAAYPPDDDGVIEASGFTLTMTGPFTNSTGSGSWSISFTDEEWNEWAPEPGVYSATRTDGSGVTE